jgi:hypothetical protein
MWSCMTSRKSGEAGARNNGNVIRTSNRSHNLALSALKR